MSEPMFNFNDRLVRSGMAAAGVALAAHLLTWLLPDTFYAFTMMQSSVAVLALVSLAVLVVTHRRRNGHLLTQTQEEMILIAAFGVSWFAILVGIRAYKRLGLDSGPTTRTNSAVATTSRGGRRAGASSWKRPYSCDSDSLYCIEEEWTWY